MRGKSEDGAALLAVLLLVAAMSALAVGVMDDIRFGIRREENAEMIGQAKWYALGAETMARHRLALLTKANGAARAKALNGQWLQFPIDNGAIRARIASATECFNLNSVVQGAAENYTKRDLGMTQFAALMKSLGIAEFVAVSLSEALADWIDTDTARNTQGAEDDSYIALRPSYRTSGALLSEVSELRAVRGFTPELYTRIRPFVCALPAAALSPININLLSPDRPELLAMVMENAIDKDTARRVLLSRPPNGWRSMDEFWNQPLLRNHLPGDAALGQLALTSRYYTVEAAVDYAGGEAVLTSLFEQGAAGAFRLTARRWTTEE
jgi:general secretion pathway protein K